MRLRKRGEQGFTLIELLVVIIILGLLAAVVVFAVRGVGDKGSSAANKIDERTVRAAQEAYCAKNGTYGSEDALAAGKFLQEKSSITDVQLTTGGPCGTDPSKLGSGFTLSQAPTADLNVAANQDQWPIADGATDGFKTSAFAYPLNANVYDPLIIIGSDYSLQPGLATSWEAIPVGSPTKPTRPYPQTTWRFHLRQGVKFHDGSDFDADDMMWTWQERQGLNGLGTSSNSSLTTVVNTLGYTRNASPGTLAPDALDSVEKIDQFTVDITPKIANLRLPEQIGHPKGAIVPVGKHFDGKTGGLPATNNRFHASYTVSTTNASATITGTAPFSPSDVGKVVFAAAPGGSVTSGRIPVGATITAVGPGNDATLSAAATSTQAAQAITLTTRVPATALVSGTPVGTGPFKFVSYSPNPDFSGSAAVEAYDAYWGTRAQVRRMNYTFILSAATRAARVQSGEVDMAIDLDPLAVAAVNASGGHVKTASYGQNLLIYVNKVVKYGPGDAQKYELTTDPAVRKAVSLAIDRQAFVDSPTIYNGNAAPGRWMAPPGILGSHQNAVPALSFDQGQARTVLDDAGWTCGSGAPGAGTACAANEYRVKNGGTFAGRQLALRLIGNDISLVPDGYALLVAEMKAVGINLTADNLTVAGRTAEYNASRFDLDLELPNQNDANPAFLPTLRFACSRSGTFRFSPADGTNGTGPSLDGASAGSQGAPVTDGRYPYGASPCATGAPNTTPAVLGPFDNTYVPGADVAVTQDAAQAAAAQQMKILVGQNDTNVVIPIAGQFRIYGLRSNVNLGDPHPSQTSQRWVSLTKT
jgi:prepilin-type N-terminal cleavage/methylation domain-containing protein